MGRIKQKLFSLKGGSLEAVDENSHDDLSAAAASAKSPGTYVLLPVLIINQKSKSDGKEESAGSPEENNEQGQSLTAQTSNSEMDKPNQTGKPGNKRKSAGKGKKK